MIGLVRGRRFLETLAPDIAWFRRFQTPASKGPMSGPRTPALARLAYEFLARRLRRVKLLTSEEAASMKATDSLDEAEALARLREHERELDRQLEDARQEVAGLMAEARQEAERLRESAEAELLQEVERLQQEASRELERALGAVRDETRRRVEVLCHQAEQNRAPALAFCLSRVTGRDTP